MSSGSSASGETRYNWNDDMAPRWNNLLNTAMWSSMTQNPDGSFSPRQRAVYPGQRFANPTQEQLGARTNMWALNDLSSSPIGAMNAARSQIEGTLGGQYLNANPYIGGAAGTNPFMNQTTQTDRNIFAGDNPYFRQALNTGMDDITSAYQRGTAADTTRMFNLSGAFGGSAHQQAVANNEAALGKTLQNYATGMLNDQFNRSAGLEDSFLARDIQNQQANAARQSGLAESQIGRGFQGYENERGRQMGAIGMGQNEQGLALGRNDALMNMGNFFQGQQQRELDFGYDQWNQQMNHPFQMMQFLSGLYGQAMGGGGFNQSVYAPSNTGGQIAGGLLGLASLLG